MRRIVAAAAIVLALAAVGWYLTTHRGTRPAPAGSAAGTVTTTASSSGLSLAPGLSGTSTEALPPADGGPDLPLLDCNAPAGDVVRVGDTPISAGTVCGELMLTAGGPTQPPSPVWRAQAKQLRDHLVDALLVHQALAGAGAAVPDADVDAAVAAIPHGTSDAAKPSGAEAEALRRQLRARLELARLVALRAAAEPTDAELRVAYDQDPSRYGEPGEATVTPFAKRLPRSLSDGEVAAAEQRVEEFLSAVQRGTAPAEAATTAGLTALAPFVLEDRGIEPELRAAAFGLGPGSWSAPTHTSIGWVVLRVDSVHPGKVLPFEQVRDKVRTSLVTADRLDRQELLLRELRAATVIADLVAW